MKKLVIIPAYNESASICSTVEDIKKNAPDFDYIVINDCSKDNTAEVCKKNNINFVDLPVNLGIGGAVQTGYMYGVRNGYDVAVQFDGDGQHSAKYLDDMVKAMTEEKVDMIIGSRFIENEGFQSSFMRRVGIRMLSSVIKTFTGHNVTDPTSGMRLVNRDVMEIYAQDYPKDYPEPESLVQIVAAGRDFKEIPVVMNERTEGVSSISPINSMYYMIKVTLAIIFARYKNNG